jgi:hypothetical protein
MLSMPAAASEALASSTPTLTISVVRTADMLSLTFLGYNLQVSGSEIVRVNSSAPAFLSVVFPGQALFEQPSADGGTPPFPPVGAVVAGASRLVWSIPNSVSSIPYSLAGLLSWTPLLPSLSKGAIGTGKPVVAQPTATQTALEVPWRLILSPDKNGRWVTSPVPVSSGLYTEVWHARLGTLVSGVVVEPPGGQPLVRAVYSPDYPGNPAGGDTFQLWSPTTLTSNDRSDLVKNTADWTQSIPSGNYVPTPAVASALTLSALGATIDIAGAWPTAPTSLKEWRHRTYLGRDTYVKRVYFGYLFPTGHPATLTVITDREFASGEGGLEAYRSPRPGP